MVEVVLVRLPIRLRVGVVYAQQSVREGVAGVQRIGGVVRKVEIALDVGLIVAGIGSALEIEAELEHVRTVDLAQVVHDLPDQEALLEGSEDAGIDGRADAGDPAESQAGDQVALVGVWIEQRRGDAGYPASGRVALRRDRYAAPANPEHELVHPGRSEVIGERYARHAARTVLPVRDRQRPVPGSGRCSVGKLLIVVVVDPAHAEPGIVRDQPVAAQDGLTAGVGTRHLGSVVVDVAACRGVGRGQKVQDPLAGGIELARRDDVVRKRRPGRRIDDVDRLAASVQRLREVPCAFEKRGDANILRRSLGH